MLVATIGFEPMTSCVSCKRSTSEPHRLNLKSVGRERVELPMYEYN